MFRPSVLALSLLVFSALLNFPAKAKKFRSSYVEFKIGYDWNCQNFGVDWACHYYLKKDDKPAFMLITAREGVSLDNTDLYIQFFNKKQKDFSKKIHTKKIMINRHVWAESIYKDNLLKDIFSRFAATVCCDGISSKIHILIGFHAPKAHYTKYANEFLRSIKSLKLAEDLKETLAQIRKQTDRQKADMMSYIDKILIEADVEEAAGPIAPKRGPIGSWLWLAGLAAACAALWFILRKKQRKKRKKRQKTRRRKA